MDEIASDDARSTADTDAKCEALTMDLQILDMEKESQKRFAAVGSVRDEVALDRVDGTGRQPRRTDSGVAENDGGSPLLERSKDTVRRLMSRMNAPAVRMMGIGVLGRQERLSEIRRHDRHVMIERTFHFLHPNVREFVTQAKRWCVRGRKTTNSGKPIWC